jgi:DUF917 family protein
MTGKELKKSVIPETITYAEDVGKSIRVATEQDEDPADAVIDKIGGDIFIRGTIVERSVKTIGGFDFGKTVVQGMDDFSGQKVTIDYKNENMIAWDGNGKMLMEVPDLICVMEKNGTTWTNADLKKGLDVVVIGIPAHQKWTQLKGKKVFSHILEKLKK